MMLEKLKLPSDLKKLNERQLRTLAAEIRKLIIETTSQNGGHLASNLGVVELTIALFRVLDLPEDKIIWDVGHQSYTHKILSGRKEDFSSLRKTGGLSGFPKSRESRYDAFDTGHSSTSVSAALGMAQARDLLGEHYNIAAVIGDGALTGGMAYEALNNASKLKSNLIIVLNDNKMSIAENTGGISNYLNGLRTAPGYTRLKKDLEAALRNVPGIGGGLVSSLKLTKDSLKKLVIPGMFFEDMGITYLGPVDGHDIRALERALNNAKKLDHAVLVHVITRKGKGYAPAEKAPELFHGVGPFDIQTGRQLKKGGKSYTSVFSETLLELAEKDSRIVGLTAAMPDGTGMAAFQKRFPDRYFDVGIAEAHGVTSAAGMAAAGLKPVFAVYSSFLQRGFDQIVHDVCLQGLPVVFAVDRAGLVGADGETHQGIFDLSYLSQIPGIEVLAPKNGAELKAMLRYALAQDGPVAVRYPRGTAYTGLEAFSAPIERGKAEPIFEGQGILLLALGSMVSTAEHIREKLMGRGISAGLANARFAKPIDEESLLRLTEAYSVIVTLEENVRSGGFGEAVEDVLLRHGSDKRILHVTLPDAYVEHGDVSALRALLGIDSDSIIARLEQEGVLDGPKQDGAAGACGAAPAESPEGESHG